MREQDERSKARMRRNSGGYGCASDVIEQSLGIELEHGRDVLCVSSFLMVDVNECPRNELDGRVLTYHGASQMVFSRTSAAESRTTSDSLSGLRADLRIFRVLGGEPPIERVMCLRAGQGYAEVEQLRQDRLHCQLQLARSIPVGRLVEAEGS